MEDIENFSFNTSVSQFMICVNELSTLKCHHRDVLAPLAVLVAPFAPHIAEELWKRLGNTESVTYASYPVHEDKYLQEDSKEYPVSLMAKYASNALCYQYECGRDRASHPRRSSNRRTTTRQHP